jgi:hypothetical protein
LLRPGQPREEQEGKAKNNAWYQSLHRFGLSL